MAERTIIMAANLTCGTTMGIVNHPLFRGRDEDLKTSERPITTMPHWDVLIVDEASKTLIQEFMVPALMARRWIIVGDVRQLPPFTDRADIVANLRDLVDERIARSSPATISALVCCSSDCCTAGAANRECAG
ncbi:AAA domain-containing protein [Nannocystis pusilla]|uniref:AAA domain-containing protein n=1 Tax=Nannocystis pusilla TaxID=889268 RepID=UPI003B7E557E